jgi:hypothetical protein
MACGNSFSFMTMEARPLIELQSSPCDGSAPLDMIECGKQGRRRVSSISTAADSSSSLPLIPLSSSSGSDTEGSDTAESNDGTIDKSHVKSGKFPCPHCFQKFETEDALYQHDTCMAMPSDMASAALSGDSTLESVGVKLDGKIQCHHCNQKFDSEKALNLHCKFIHAQESEMNVGYTLVYEFDSSKSVTTSMA